MGLPLRIKTHHSDPSVDRSTKIIWQIEQCHQAVLHDTQRFKGKKETAPHYSVSSKNIVLRGAVNCSWVCFSWGSWKWIHLEKWGMTVNWRNKERKKERKRGWLAEGKKFLSKTWLGVQCPGVYKAKNWICMKIVVLGKLFILQNLLEVFICVFSQFSIIFYVFRMLVTCMIIHNFLYRQELLSSKPITHRTQLPV